MRSAREASENPARIRTVLKLCILRGDKTLGFLDSAPDCTSRHLVQLPFELANVFRGHCELDQFVKERAVSFPDVVYAFGQSIGY